MNTILIRTNETNGKILSSLTKQLGGDAIKLNVTQLEDLLLGNQMDKEKTGQLVSKKTILKRLRVK